MKNIEVKPINLYTLNKLYNSSNYKTHLTPEEQSCTIILTLSMINYYYNTIYYIKKMHNKLLVLSDRDKFFNSLYKEFKSDIMVKAENIHFKFKEMFGEKYILESDFIQGTSFSDFDAVKTIAYFNEESIDKTYRRLELLSDSGICEFFGKKSIYLQDNTMHNMKHAADDKTYFYYYHIPEYCQLKTDDGFIIDDPKIDADDLRFSKTILEECMLSFCEIITLIDYMYDKLKS